MKKIIQTLVLLCLLSSTDVYSENLINEINVSDSLSDKKENIGTFELGIGIEERGIAKFKTNFIYCFPINSNLSWGIGTGLHIYNPNYFLIPLYANFKADLYTDKTTPYFSTNTGYYLLSNHSYHGFLVNPAIGVSFKKTNGKSINIGVGYDMWLVDRIYFTPFRDLVTGLTEGGLFSINLGVSL